jgi:hypothetical protein
LHLERSDLVSIPSYCSMKRGNYRILAGFDRNNGRSTEVIKTSFGNYTLEYIYSLKSDSDIQIVKLISRWKVDGYQEPQLVNEEYSYVIPGFSIQEVMEDFDLENDIKLEDINEALDILQENSIISIVTIHNSQPRFEIGKEILLFVRKYISLKYEELILLIYKEVLALTTSVSEEKKSLHVAIFNLYGGFVGRILEHCIDEAKVETRRILRTYTNLEDYNAHLKVGVINLLGIRLVSGYPNELFDLFLKGYQDNHLKLRIYEQNKIGKLNRMIAKFNEELLCYHMFIQQLIPIMLNKNRGSLNKHFAEYSQYAYLRRILDP